MYQHGLYLDYSTDQNISPPKSFAFNLQESKTMFESGFDGIYFNQDSWYSVHMGYANNKNIYIFYGDGKKDITYIDFKTYKLRTIAKSKLKKSCLFGQGVRMGNRFLMTCDKEDIHLGPYSSIKKKTHLWSDRKERFTFAPTLTATAYSKNCVTSFNRYS